MFSPFSKLLEILVSQKTNKKKMCFFVTYRKFYSWKVFRLEDINENILVKVTMKLI